MRTQPVRPQDLGVSRVSTAVISDIHGNAARCTAGRHPHQGCQTDYLPGDIIGYGPEPLECVDLVAEHCEWSLLGNHDFAVLYEPNFNPGAEAAAYWTRRAVRQGRGCGPQPAAPRFLGRLRVRVLMNGSGIGRHGVGEAGTGGPRLSPSPDQRVHLPDDAINSPDKMKSLFDLVDGVAIVGHSTFRVCLPTSPTFIPG